MSHPTPQILDLIRQMAEALEPYQDDEELYRDTLDGETNILDLIEREAAAAANDEALKSALNERMTSMAGRFNRITARISARRGNIALLMRAGNLRKAEVPSATVSVSPGRQSVLIEDAAEVPSQLMRETVRREPDKAAIKRQLEQGEDVPGARLVQGDDIVTLRVA